MPVNEVFVGCLESDEYFNAAKLDELKKWEQFEVYDEVKDVGQKYLTGRWVCTEKVTDEGRIQWQHEVKLLSLAAFCEKRCGIILCGSKMPSFLRVYTRYQLMY